MKVNELRPMMWTRELEASIQFYTEVLGCELAEYNEDWGWASLFLDNAGIMLARPNEHLPFDIPVFTGSFYFNTDDVDAWWLKLKDKVSVCYPIDNFDYGMREFAIYDNNGYILQFGTPFHSGTSDSK